jgi:hypothetical protein
MWNEILSEVIVAFSFSIQCWAGGDEGEALPLLVASLKPPKQELDVVAVRERAAILEFQKGGTG